MHLTRAALAASLVALASIAAAQPRRPRPPARRPPSAVASPVGDVTPYPLHVLAHGERLGAQSDPACVARRGCAAPRTPPLCEADATALHVSEFLARRDSLRGQVVRVMGALRQETACTTMACPADRCCNRCGGALVLFQLAGGPFVRIGAEGDAAWACQGDDSGVCCATEVSGSYVRLTGTVTVDPDGVTRLTGVTVCQGAPPRCGTA